MHACTHDPPRANLPTHTYIGRAGKLNASTPLGGGVGRRTRTKDSKKDPEGKLCFHPNSRLRVTRLSPVTACHLTFILDTARGGRNPLLHTHVFGFPPSSLTHAPLSTLRHQCVMMSQRGGLLAFIGTSRSCGIEFMQEWFICFFTGLAF